MFVSLTNNVRLPSFRHLARVDRLVAGYGIEEGGEAAWPQLGTR